MLAKDFIGPEAANPLVRGADIGDDQVAVRFPDDILDVLGEQPVVGFAALKSFLGQVFLQRNAGQSGALFDEVDVVFGRLVWLAVIDGKGAEHPAVRSEDRLRPAGAETGAGRQFLVGRPVGMRRNILDDDALARKSCRAA